MKNLKIGVRLGLGFGCMVVLIAVMAVFAFVQLNKMHVEGVEIHRSQQQRWEPALNDQVGHRLSSIRE